MLSDQTLRKERENVKGQVLGTFFGGVRITDFWGACKAIETLAKQRCYFHMFTELVKVDKLNASATWKRFRTKLSRFLKEAVRPGDQHANSGTNANCRPSTKSFSGCAPSPPGCASLN